MSKRVDWCGRRDEILLYVGRGYADRVRAAIEDFAVYDSDAETITDLDGEIFYVVKADPFRITLDVDDKRGVVYVLEVEDVSVGLLGRAAPLEPDE